MYMVGIKELKNRLTHYLRLTKTGGKVIVTDRGKPIAIFHSLDIMEETAGVEERLAILSKRGLVRLPIKKGKLSYELPIRIKGKPVSEIIIEER